MPFLVRFLRFADVDPRRHPFDRERARAVVTHVVGSAVGGGLDRKTYARGWDGDRLEAAIAQALVEAIGPWCDAFRWAASEPGGGGPVRGYCCPRDSLLRKDDVDARASIERVLAALGDFRAWIEELADRFDVLHAETAARPTEEAVEIAAARLLPVVVERTHAEDAWYATFARVLAWYLEAIGHDPARVEPIVHGVIGGRFESWVAPSPELSQATATELGLAVGAASSEGVATTEDALARFRAIRERAFVHPPYAWSIPIGWDGHLRFIEGPESARDPSRAARMRAALHACRASARRGEPLDFEALARFQAIVLGEPAPFRTTDAYAKQGRERYALDRSTRERFAHWLAQANDPTTPWAVRAARVYLDVCFTHPFADGNARAARLALDHVLARENLVLRAVEPLFLVARSASDAEGASALVWLVGYLAGPLASS